MKQTRQNVMKCVGVAALLYLALPARAGGHAQDAAAIRLAYKKMDQAAHDKDAAAYWAFAEPDYTAIDTHGKLEDRSKAEALKGAIYNFAMMDRVTQHTTLRRIRFDTQGAAVETSVTNSIEKMVKGKDLLMQAGGTERDLWVKRGNVWLMKTTKDMTFNMTIKANGKVVSTR